MGDTFWIFLTTQISQVRSIFRTKKIVDEKLRSVSFHNNLVASSNIQNWCREAALNTGPYAGGKTRWCFLRLKTSGRDSHDTHTSPAPKNVTSLVFDFDLVQIVCSSASATLNYPAVVAQSRFLGVGLA